MFSPTLEPFHTGISERLPEDIRPNYFNILKGKSENQYVGVWRSGTISQRLSACLEFYSLGLGFNQKHQHTHTHTTTHAHACAHTDNQGVLSTGLRAPSKQYVYSKRKLAGKRDLKDRTNQLKHPSSAGFFIPWARKKKGTFSTRLSVYRAVQTS